MADLNNPARRRLEENEMSLGVGIRFARSVEIVNSMKAAGFDWLFLDLEHSTMSLDTASQISLAALDAGISPIARVPRGEYAMATRLLDNGALGMVIPHVETAEEAADVVEHLKFPPVGHRSVMGNMPHFGYRPMSMADTADALNQSSLTIVMLESPKGVENALDIAGVPGIDVLMVGSNDLCAEMGITGDFRNPRYIEALERVVEACGTAGKWPGLAGVYAEDLIPRYAGLGFRFILCGSDLGFMTSAASSRAALLRAANP